MLGEKVKHIKFGIGTVSKEKEGIVEVEFDQLDVTKSFAYPKSFEKFISFVDADRQEQALVDLQKEKAKDAELKENREIELHERLEIKKVKKTTPRGKKAVAKAVKKENISLKCTFCDGGSNETSFGFTSVCSSDNLKNNIKKGRVNCLNSTCKKYYNGEITYDELVEWNNKSSFLCNESIYLKDWKVYAGYHLSGPNKGNPVVFKNVQKNKLVVLTTRLPGTTEQERLIFGVFLVSDYFEGSALNEGHIDACENYRISMTPKEAQEIKFWKYYQTKRTLDRVQFGSGLHKYLSDEQAVQMLMDIVEAKKGSEDEAKSNEFLQHYIEVNKVDITTIGKPSGPRA